MTGPGLRSTRLLALLLLLPSLGCQEIRARQYIKDGNDLYRQGEFRQAVAKYRQAQAIRPDLPQVYLHVAYADLSLFVPGDSSPQNQAVAKEAIDSFNQYLGLRPDDEKTRQLMIQTLIDSGRYDDALAFFQAKLDQNPRDLEAIKALGVISSKAGRFEDGLKWYERRGEVTPTDPEAFYAIGTLCWERLYQRADKVGADRIAVADRGLAALRKAMELKPKYTEAITYVNLLYRERALGQPSEEERAKDLEQARTYLVQAMELRGLPVPSSAPASAPADSAGPERPVGEARARRRQEIEVDRVCRGAHRAPGAEQSPAAQNLRGDLHRRCGAHRSLAGLDRDLVVVPPRGDPAAVGGGDLLRRGSAAPPPPPPARKKREQPKPKPVVQPTLQQVKQALVQPKVKEEEPEPDKEEDPGVEGGVEGGVPGGVVGGVLGGEKDTRPVPTPTPAPVAPKVVPPTVLETQKISGAIPPLPPTVKDAAFSALGNQPGMLTAIFKVCIGGDGNMSQVNLIKSSGAPALDEFIKSNLRTWRYRPYMINGKATPICGTKVFNLRLE